MRLGEDFHKPMTLADSVEHSILQYVRREKLMPGDSLPKEEEIAAQLNVSRHIVREGISGLKTLGVIESRKRRGMILREKVNAFEGVRKLASARLFSKEECRQFMQIRVIMEMGMVSYIWKNRTSEKIAELRVLAEKKDIQHFQNEIDFHSKLFSMGGNDIANQFQDILISAFDPHYHQPSRNIDGDTAEHLQICNVLEYGTEDEFRKLMERHFETYLQTKNTKKED